MACAPSRTSTGSLPSSATSSPASSRSAPQWQRKVALLKSESIDPDTLDERARAVLNYLDPREVTLTIKRP